MQDKMSYQDILTKAYDAFNARHIDEVLSLMTDDVQWPNGWEGGYVGGQEQVRDYWTRQWAVLNPRVLPVTITQLADGRVAVNVQQIVKDLQDNLLADGMVRHIYSFTNGLISHMEIVAQ